MLILTLISSLIIITLGCLLHFAYAWSHKSRFVAIFAAVNESTWEHIKIALFPTFAFFLVLALFNNFQTSPETFLVGSAACLAIITFGIPITYYFMKAILKKSYLAVDIGIFCIVILLGVLTFFSICAPHTAQILTPTLPDFYSITAYYDFPDWLLAASALFICILILSTFMFTFYPPKLFIFRDPINKKYGLAAFEHGHRSKRHVRRQKTQKTQKIQKVQKHQKKSQKK